MNKSIIIIILSMYLSGCMGLAEKSVFGGDRVTTASANQLLSPKFEVMTVRDFVYLLDSSGDSWNGKGNAHMKHIRKALDAANSGGESRRSQIQDYMILASNQRCNVYKTYIKRVSVYNNSIFGTLTTVLGGAGAIVTGENTARLLSGLAGISSGTRAELNQSIFESVATSIIIPGIEMVRKDHYDLMMSKRSSSISSYTIEGALADVVAYHGACSMDKGIARAQKSIQSFEDVGIAQLQSVNEKLAEIRSTSQSSFNPKITIAKDEIDAIKKRFDVYAIPPLNTALIAEANTIINLIQPGGSEERKALALDSEMKDILALYNSTTGHDKSVYGNAIKAKQEQINTLIQAIRMKEKDFFDKL